MAIVNGACRYSNRCEKGYKCRGQHIARCKLMDQFEKPKSIIKAKQIWRDIRDDEHVEILHQDYDRIIEYLNDKGEALTCEGGVFMAHYALVTIDNIKEGEWIHDAHNNIKVKVLAVDESDVCRLTIGCNLYVTEDQLKYYNPCLPPQESRGLTHEELEKVTHEHIDKIELLQSIIKEKNERIKELIDESEQLEKESYNNAINDVVLKLNEHKEIVKEMSKDMIDKPCRSDHIFYIKNRGRLSVLIAEIRNIKKLIKD